MVYASQPTRYTNIIKPAETAISDFPASNGAEKRSSAKDNSNKKNKKPKTNNAIEMAEKVREWSLKGMW